MSAVTIADYGRGNTKSVLRAFESLGIAAQLCADADAVRRAERMVLPGVGAFGDGVARENILGLQFHPEKSGTKGIDLLRAFVADSA